MSRNKRMMSTYQSEDVMVNGTLHRRCAFCGELKTLDKFAKNGRNADGDQLYRQDCRCCYNIRRNENATKKKHSDFIGSQKRRSGEVSSYSHQEWKEVLIYFGGECAYCGATPRKGHRLTRDHLTPVNIGGKTIASNIVPACQCCNSSKGATEMKVWFMKQPFFSQERLNKIMKWRTILRMTEPSVD